MSQVAETTGSGAWAGDGEVVIEVQDLHVSFQGRVGVFKGLSGKQPVVSRAVDGINFQLRRGEVLALAGESGCGKTTTARAIMGLQPLESGQILFEGEPLPRNLKPYRRKVQMVFQDPTGTLNPRQTIYEIVAEGLRIHGIDRGPNGEPEEQLVGRALSHAGLRPPERFFLRYPHEVSGVSASGALLVPLLDDVGTKVLWLDRRGGWSARFHCPGGRSSRHGSPPTAAASRSPRRVQRSPSRTYGWSIWPPSRRAG